MTDLYRKNVGIVVCNSKHKVLMCARADKADFQWQFPQGGIETEEDVVRAAKRELREETGLISVELVSMLKNPLTYDFPQNSHAKIYSGVAYKGQRQWWVLFRFVGQDSEINFQTNPDEIEFKAFEWVDIDEAPKRIVEFKKEVYYKVVESFSPLV